MLLRYRNTILLGIISIFTFLLLAIYITYPLVFHLGDYVTGYGDELLIAWIQNWVIHALSTNPLRLFDANLFFPYKDTLAYADSFISTSILSVIPLKIIGQPIATFNFTVLSSIFLVPFSIFILAWYLTKNYLASLLSGILVQFAPAFLDKKVHLQILALEWIPFSILFFILFQKNKQTRYLILSMLFFLVQTYNNFMSGYFLVFFYFIYLLFLFFREKSSIGNLLSWRHLAIVATTFILIIPIIYPYYRVSAEFNAKRDIRDAVHFALQPEDLFYPNEHTRLQKYLLSLPINQHSQNNEFKPGYLGLVFTLLVIAGLCYFIKNFKRNNLYLFTLMSASLIGIILSLGPVLHFGRQTVHIPFPIPLPYALFYYILPGFQGFRNSARFEMMFIIFMPIVIAFMLDKLLRRHSLCVRSVIYLVLAVGVIAEYNYPMKFYSVVQKSEFPTVYSWLNTIPEGSSSITMPIYSWYMPGFSEEFKREYYSTVNWRKTVNGASGFTPPQWGNLVSNLHSFFPNNETINQLRSLNIKYIIVDKNAYDREFGIRQQQVDGDYVLNALKNNHLLRFVKSLENYYVFEYIR